MNAIESVGVYKQRYFNRRTQERFFLSQSGIIVITVLPLIVRSFIFEHTARDGTILTM